MESQLNITKEEIEKGILFETILLKSGLSVTFAQTNRMIFLGACKINGRKVVKGESISLNDFEKNEATLSIGKRTFCKINLV